MVAQNEMDEVTMATPAIVGDRLLIRTIRELVCLRPEAVDLIDPKS